jgi:hypothetical protein
MITRVRIAGELGQERVRVSGDENGIAADRGTGQQLHRAASKIATAFWIQP